MTGIRGAFFVVVPGEPFSQPRARATVINGHAVVYDPKHAKQWKSVAQDHMANARAQWDSGLLEGPLQMHVVAVFSLPQSKWKKRAPVPMQWSMSTKDWDNIGKAVADSANGIWFADDRQIVDGRVQKIIGAQGQMPGTYIGVAPITDIFETDRTRPLASYVWDMIPLVINPGGVLPQGNTTMEG